MAKTKLPKGFRVTVIPVTLVDGTKHYAGRVWRDNQFSGETHGCFELRSDARDAGNSLALRLSKS